MHLVGRAHLDDLAVDLAAHREIAGAELGQFVDVDELAAGLAHRLLLDRGDDLVVGLELVVADDRQPDPEHRGAVFAQRAGDFAHPCRVELVPQLGVEDLAGIAVADEIDVVGADLHHGDVGGPVLGQPRLGHVAVDPFLARALREPVGHRREPDDFERVAGGETALERRPEPVGKAVAEDDDSHRRRRTGRCRVGPRDAARGPCDHDGKPDHRTDQSQFHTQPLKPLSRFRPIPGRRANLYRHEWPPRSLDPAPRQQPLDTDPARAVSPG